MARSRIGIMLATVSLGVLGTVGAQAANAAKADESPASAGGDAAAPDCGGVTPPKPGGGTYVCTFADDFDGREVDTSKWLLADTSESGFSTASTCFTPDNVRVRGGELQLLTTKTLLSTRCESPLGSHFTRYRGGSLSTWGRFAQVYGRFEARISYPDARGGGVHANFWLNPRDRAYGAWPHSGEIDVAEWFSARPDRAYPSLHYAGRTQADTGWSCVAGDPTSYHTYALEWTPRAMHFYYDGRLCFSRAWTPDAPLSAPAPFDKAFHMAVTNGAGGMWNAPAPGTRFPATMSVDYVRVWR